MELLFFLCSVEDAATAAPSVKGKMTFTVNEAEVSTGADAAAE